VFSLAIPGHEQAATQSDAMGVAAVTIAGSTVLIIVGAILRFAVTWTTNGVDIHVVGDILMAGGVVGLIIALTLTFRGRRTVTTTRARGAGDPNTRVYEQRSYTDDPNL
jgi:hypothetical protein